MACPDSELYDQFPYSLLRHILLFTCSVTDFQYNPFLPAGDVIVNKLLEGSSIIESKSLKAKMINGENVQLRAQGSIDVGAMYSLESALRTTKGNVHVGLMQGNTKVCIS